MEKVNKEETKKAINKCKNVKKSVNTTMAPLWVSEIRCMIKLVYKCQMICLTLKYSKV